MQVVGHLVKDQETFHAYFHEDAPARELMWFIENHCNEVFRGKISHIPTAFAMPKLGGGTVEAAVVMDIMDVTGEDPVLHLVLELVTVNEVEEKSLS